MSMNVRECLRTALASLPSHEHRELVRVLIQVRGCSCVLQCMFSNIAVFVTVRGYLWICLNVRDELARLHMQVRECS